MNNKHYWFKEARTISNPDIIHNLYGSTIESSNSALTEYGLHYHRRCETYDQDICNAVNERGIAIPITHDEQRSVNHNARMVMNELAEELVIAGLATQSNKLTRMYEAIRMSSDIFDREWNNNCNRDI
jgi:hypothetical protein